MNNGILPMAQYVRTGEANGGAENLRNVLRPSATRAIIILRTE